MARSRKRKPSPQVVDSAIIGKLTLRRAIEERLAGPARIRRDPWRNRKSADPPAIDPAIAAKVEAIVDSALLNDARSVAMKRALDKEVASLATLRARVAAAVAPSTSTPEPSPPTPARPRLFLKAWVQQNRHRFDLKPGEIAESFYRTMADTAKAEGVEKAHWTTVRDYMRDQSNKR